MSLTRTEQAKQVSVPLSRTRVGTRTTAVPTSPSTVAPDPVARAGDVRTAVLAALSPTFGKTVGKVMRTVRETTGNGSLVPDILDRLTADGRVIDTDGRYTLREDV